MTRGRRRRGNEEATKANTESDPEVCGPRWGESAAWHQQEAKRTILTRGQRCSESASGRRSQRGYTGRGEVA
eukprot:8566323-Pyramimonas_sp.AAC.1